MFWDILGRFGAFWDILGILGHFWTFFDVLLCCVVIGKPSLVWDGLSTNSFEAWCNKTNPLHHYFQTSFNLFYGWCNHTKRQWPWLVLIGLGLTWTWHLLKGWCKENKLLHHDWLGLAWLGMADVLGRFGRFGTFWDVLGCFGTFWDILGCFGTYRDGCGHLGIFEDVWDENQFSASLFSNKLQLVLRMMQSYQEAMNGLYWPWLALAGLAWPGLGWTGLGWAGPCFNW